MSGEKLTRADFMRGVFGNRDRIDAWHAISQYTIEPPEVFLQQDIIRKTGLPGNVVQPAVRILHQLGAIEAVPQDFGRSKPYVRAESPVWSIV